MAKATIRNAKRTATSVTSKRGRGRPKGRLNDKTLRKLRAQRRQPPPVVEAPPPPSLLQQAIAAVDKVAEAVTPELLPPAPELVTVPDATGFSTESSEDLAVSAPPAAPSTALPADAPDDAARAAFAAATAEIMADAGAAPPVDAAPGPQVAVTVDLDRAREMVERYFTGRVTPEFFHWLPRIFDAIAVKYNNPRLSLEEWEHLIWKPAVADVWNRYMPELLKRTDNPELAGLALAAFSYVLFRTDVFAPKLLDLVKGKLQAVRLTSAAATSTPASAASSSISDNPVPERPTWLSVTPKTADA